MTARGALALFAMTVLLAGCQRDEMPEAPEGAALFAENCAICHGRTGQGDGPLAKDLALPPPDLRGITRRAGGSFPRAEVLSQIDGYTRTGTSAGPNMPEFGALLRSPLVPVDTGDGVMTPTPRSLVALMVYIESLQN